MVLNRYAMLSLCKFLLHLYNTTLPGNMPLSEADVTGREHRITLVSVLNVPSRLVCQFSTLLGAVGTLEGGVSGRELALITNWHLL